jgi:hypothetical protein
VANSIYCCITSASIIRSVGAEYNGFQGQKQPCSAAVRAKVLEGIAKFSAFLAGTHVIAMILSVDSDWSQAEISVRW